MTLPVTPRSEEDSAGIKRVPADAETRAAIRRAAAGAAAALDARAAPDRSALEAAGEEVLAGLGLARCYLGFAMVAVDNAFWSADYMAVPHRRRLLLLPKCLSKSRACRAEVDAHGLHCAECGACEIPGLTRLAHELGGRVVVAEGTSGVITEVLEGRADAVLGVACLDSLEKSFERISDLGIPHQAVPLLCDGCVDTTAEFDLIRALLSARGEGGRRVTRTYLPLLREATELFEPARLDRVLDGCACPGPDLLASGPALGGTDAIAREWLACGGKRLRPFVTLAAYAVGRHGVDALGPGADLEALLPESVRRMAVAIEALHKASLVHDDVEDRDLFRYGRPTLHRVHGVDTAINVGDYLVGLGYHLIAAQTEELGAGCVADILARLSGAHLRLCCGQGAELLWNRRDGGALRAVDALQIGALKTAPAFEVALYCGLRAAEAPVDEGALRRFSVLVGEAFQVRNDLDDWAEDAADGAGPGRDALAGRPTILRAFAIEAGGAERLPQAPAGASPAPDPALVEALRRTYDELGAFDKAEVLYARLRERALAPVATLGSPAIQELLRFLVRNILPAREAERREAR